MLTDLPTSTPSETAAPKILTPNWTTQVDLFQPFFQAKRPGLITDIDGVISPIVARPEDAEITPRNLALLDALKGKLAKVGVVSGRGVKDVVRRVGLEGVAYIGNHGLDCWDNDHVEVAPSAAPYRPALVAAMKELEIHRATHPDLLQRMQIEDKGATISIHYRRTEQPELVENYLDPVLHQIALRESLALFPGRMIFELRPPIEINKGTAFSDLIKWFELDAAIYIGDDTTDADAMRAARSQRAAGTCYAVGVGVLSDDTPSVVLEAADVFATGISDVESFLEWVLNQFKASSN
jgi:trehalose 6-phosphate phosphatase